MRLSGNAGEAARAVAVQSEALTAQPVCYGAAGLQPTAPWPMIGLCPLHRGQSPVVAAQTNAKAPGTSWASGVALGAAARGAAVVAADGTIYVGSSTGLFARKLDGTAKWTAAATPGIGLGASPAIGADGTVYYVTTGSSSIVRALTPGTTSPTQKWATTSTVFGGTASSGPVLDATTVYASSQNGKLVALRTAVEGSNAAGSARWTYKTNATTPSPFWTSPAFGIDGTLYIGADNGLYAVDPATGTVVASKSWNGTSVPSANSPAAIVRSNPVVGPDGTVYFGTDNKGLVAVKDGVFQWRYPSSGTPPIIRSSPAVDSNGVIYFGTEGTATAQKVFALNPNGTVKWAFVPAGNVDSSPAIGADGVVYIGSDDKKVYALRANGTATTPTTVFSFTIGSGATSFVRSALSIGRSGALYIPTDDGNLWALGTCSASDATCDGKDDNCSGAADEGYVGVTTNCGVGACARTGTSSCVGGAVQQNCTAGTPAATDTTCNNVDDNCNGTNDEGYAGVTTNCGVGACARTGTSLCVGGAVQQNCTAGTPAATDTTCNNVDDNCNGTKDEGYVRVTTNCGVGACARTGTSSCVGGAVQQNCTAGTPAASDATCNNVDDNCNGTNDEGYVGVTTNCGVGACARTGTSSCMGGAVQPNCTAGTPAASDTTCDNVDDNCNGTKDEGYVSQSTSCGVGACVRSGATSCVSGVVQNSCAPGTPAANDPTCNGVDDDCNGVDDLCLVVQGSTIVVVDPVTATASSELGTLGNPTTYDRVAVHTIDSSALMIPGNQTINNANANAPTEHTRWLSNGVDAPSAVHIDWDLGATKTLAGFHLWNYNESGYENTRGIVSADVWVSNSANFSTHTDLGVMTFGPAVQVGLAGVGTVDYGLDYRLPTVTSGRFVRFSNLTNGGVSAGGDFVGISEIRFYAQTLQSCGNGVVDSGEQCDDGNQVDTDQCRNDCTLGRVPEMIFGSSVAEWWDSSVGLGFVGGAVDTWTGQRSGTVLHAPAAANRPGYLLTDPSFANQPTVNFNCGPPTVNCNSGLYLDSGILPGQLAAVGSHPYLLMISRERGPRDPSNDHRIIELRGTDTSLGGFQMALLANGGADAFSGWVQPPGGPFHASSSSRDTSTHLFAVEMDSSTGLTFHVDDHAYLDTRPTPGLGEAIQHVTVGAISWNGTPAALQFNDVSVAQIALLSSAPTAAQLASYRGFLEAKFGVAAACGNGIVEAHEDCDDGNTVETDACHNNCTTQSVDAIFGSSVVETWDARAGTTLVDGKVSAWAGQKQGITVTAPAAANQPTYAADGSLFNGKPVVQFSGGTQFLQARQASPFVATGTRPYIAFVGRLRTVTGNYSGASLVTFRHVLPGTNDDGGMAIYQGQLRNGDTGGPWALSYRWQGETPQDLGVLPHDTQAHLFEYILSATTGISLYVDGQLVARNNNEAVGTAQLGLYTGLDQVLFCVAESGDGPLVAQIAELSLAQVILLDSEPSATQRAALLDKVRSDWGTSCTTSSTNACVPSSCGDGNVTGNEQCDPGSQPRTATCDTNCTFAACGDGRFNPAAGETCDNTIWAPTQCPATCDDNNACTTDVKTGDEATCNVVCTHAAVGACISGDGCCAPGCNTNNDSDCNPVLDRIAAQPAAAYSVAKRLSVGYTGAALRVRRASDNAEQDIGFTGYNVVDLSSLATFCGAADCLVSAVYDQSGRAQHLTQSDTTAQIKIYDGASGAPTTVGPQLVLSVAQAGQRVYRPDTLGFTGNPDFTIAYAGRLGRASASANASPFRIYGGDHSSPGDQITIGYAGETFMFYAGGYATNWQPSVPTTRMHAGVMRHSAGTPTNASSVRIAGADAAEVQSGGGAVNLHLTPFQTMLGKDSSDHEGSPIDTATVLVFPSVLAGNDLATVEAFLATDSDGDGTADANDQCPFDAARVVRGQCGCVGESNLMPSGTACSDGACTQSNACDGQGNCGSPAQCAPASNCVVKVYDNHAYSFCPTGNGWQAARSTCTALAGTDLVHIENTTEDAFITTNVSSTAWIGATDSATEGAWFWADDGSQFWSGNWSGAAVGGRYSAWALGQPDDALGNQDCAAHATSLAAWSDEVCDASFAFVCEAGDQCPNDPSKRWPGICGCGVADLDSDGDGVFDCKDGCPSDPTKNRPGMCGCGVPDPFCAVTPTISCVNQSSATDFSAVFGYESEVSADTTIAAGTFNSFAPAPALRGQPTVFSNGSHSGVVTVPFDGTSLTWTLGTTSITATGSTPRCNDVQPLFECVLPQPDGSTQAVFQVINTTGNRVSFPIGATNQFSPGPASLGQPTIFEPGAQHVVVPLSGSLLWTLGSHTVTANSAATTCTTIIQNLPNPIILRANVDNDTGTQQPAQGTTSAPLTFAIPERLRVTLGNAANGTALFQYLDNSGGQVTCTYRGHSSVPNPLLDLDIALGRYYFFDSCSNGLAAGATTSGTQWSVTVVSGDTDISTTSVELQLGNGCSGVLDPPILPHESIGLRDNFSWRDTQALPTTDPAGLPAMRYALIYVETDEQIKALDAMGVYYRARPIFAPDLDRYQGQCGKIDSSDDGWGRFVYAIIPATLYNYWRDLTMPVINQGQGQVPFRAILLPSIPDPAVANADGTLSWAAMQASGFTYLDDDTTLQQPGFFHFLKKILKKVVNAAKDSIAGVFNATVAVGGNILTTGLSLLPSLGQIVTHGVTLIHDAWSLGKQAIGGISKFFAGSVRVSLEFTVLNPDPVFGGRPITRAWGPTNAAATTPRFQEKLAPEGAHVEILQWSLGFLPSETRGKIGHDGRVTLRVPKGLKIRHADGGGGGLCMEFRNNAAIIRASLVPDDFCNFGIPDTTWEGFHQDVPLNPNGTSPYLEVRGYSPEINALTQMTDGYDYMRSVVGVTPSQAEVAIGDFADVIGTAQSLSTNGQPRPFTPCLAFNVMANSTELLLGQSLSVPVADVAGFAALVSSPASTRDIFLPSGAPWSWSRGVVTHEYGHFVMCDLYNSKFPEALVKLYLDRLTKGIDTNDRTAGVTVMMESFADFFASQVTGGFNYADVSGALHDTVTDTLPEVFGGMSYCHGRDVINTQSASPDCAEWNYRGESDAVGAPGGEDGFKDEVTRRVSTFHDAFDAPSDDWRSVGDHWVPTNADPWCEDPLNSPQTLTSSTVGSLQERDDAVSLDGPAIKTWIQHSFVDANCGSINGTCTMTPMSMLRGLADQMRAKGYTWCQICELFARHYPLLPNDDIEGEDGTGLPSCADGRDNNNNGLADGNDPACRVGSCRNGVDDNGDGNIDDMDPNCLKAGDLWTACVPELVTVPGHDTEAAELSNIVGPPPDPNVHLDATTCAPCGVRDTWDPKGVCTTCPGDRQVVQNNVCVECAQGWYQKNGTCTPCGNNEVSVGNSCVPCDFDQYADRSSNSCAPCPPNFSVHWSDLSAPECTVMATPEIVQSVSAQCPAAYVVYVDNLGVIGSSSPAPTDFHVDGWSYTSLGSAACGGSSLTLSSHITRYDSLLNEVASFGRQSTQNGAACLQSCLGSCVYASNVVEELPPDYIESTVKTVRVAIDIRNLSSTPTVLSLWAQDQACLGVK